MKSDAKSLRRALTASSLRTESENLPEKSALDLLGLLRRVFGYTRPYAHQRNVLIGMVLLRSMLLPAAAWAIGDMAYFDRTKVGRIIGRITSDLDAVRVGVQDIVFVSMVQLGQMLITALLMLWYDWLLFGIVLLIAPGLWKLNTFFKRRITEQQRKSQESFSRVTAVLTESVSGMRLFLSHVRCWPTRAS